MKSKTRETKSISADGMSFKMKIDRPKDVSDHQTPWPKEIEGGDADDISHSLKNTSVSRR